MNHQKINQELKRMIELSQKIADRIKNTLILLRKERPYETLHERTEKLLQERHYDIR